MSEYRALVPIDHGTVRAYNVGDLVPAVNVEEHGYVVGEQVEEIGADPKPTESQPAEGEPATEPTAAPALAAVAPEPAGKRLPKPAAPDA